jgi:hypothetical protein
MIKLVLSVILTSTFTAFSGLPAPASSPSLSVVPGSYQTTNIPFTVAQNYFVKNTVTTLKEAKITTQEKFDEVFGAAATMGAGGQPTDINFSTHYVVAVVLPETDLSTTVTPVSLQRKSKNELILTYKTVVGQKQSYTTRPNFMIVVDKKHSGNITLKATK